MTTGVLMIGHGSRDPAANRELEAIVAGHRRADAIIEHAYVELAQPGIADGLASLAARVDRVVALPLLLFAAGHVKNDLPLILHRARAAAPRTEIIAARALGVHAALVELGVARLRAVLPAGERAVVIVVGRGASDPDANGDLCKLARLIGEQVGASHVLPAFAGITGPSVDEALELAARARPARIVVLPYLLCAGRLVDRLHAQVEAARARAPWIDHAVAPHLGDDPRLHAAVSDRISEALAGTAPLPCDTCHYRVPLAGVAEVGGLRALLWSVRHTVTHAQSMPHVHAHRPLRKHVLVCTNADCAARGGVGVLVALRRALQDAARADIRVTRTSCMGRCGEGPTVVVYPDGVFYRGVAASDADELVRDHLLNDRLVSRLVDHVMT